MSFETSLMVEAFMMNFRYHSDRMTYQSATLQPRMLCLWRKLLPIFVLILLHTSAMPVNAGGQIWKRLLRQSAKVGKNVPLTQADDVAAALGRSPEVRKTAEKALENSGKLSPKLKGAAREAAEKAALAKLLKKLLIKPELVKQVTALDKASRQTALVLAKGGETLSQAAPDIALRGRLLKEGGPDLIAALGLHGKGAASESIRLATAIQGGTLVLPQGVRAVTLADFGKAMTKYGGASWTFWQDYVRPHWKTWLVSGALAAYLVDPEAFQDAAGRLTREGFRRVTELAGHVAAEAIRGIGQGSEVAGKQIGDAVKDTYLSGWKSLFAVFTTIVILLVIFLAIPRLRHYVLRPIRWIRKGMSRSIGANSPGVSASTKDG
jgi:hypothetical protein